MLTAPMQSSQQAREVPSCLFDSVSNSSLQYAIANLQDQAIKNGNSMELYMVLF
jgi:hypothetical protein